MSRRGWFRVHQATGLGIVIGAVLSASSGAILLYREALTPPRPRAPATGEAVALERIVAAGQAAGDGSRATDITLPAGADEPYVVWLDDDAETEVYVAADGRVVGTRRGREKITRWLFRLHTGELFGPIGTVLMLVTGVGLTVLVTSGLAMIASRTIARRRKARRSDAPAQE